MDDAAQPNRQLCRRSDALEVLLRLRKAGHIAYFAGGCVRDLLLGIDPKDYDIATDAPPDRVRALFRNTQAVGQAFGVILVRQGPSVVEVATFRSDGRYRDGRHPESVKFVTPQEDARRRDFTINGLFLDPTDDRVIDYVDGQRDLEARLLRAIGDPARRFEEDHLRLLRAVRFAARFNFDIESATAAAMKRQAPQLARISPERIAEELRRILPPPSRTIAWRLLRDYGLADVIFRFLPDLQLNPESVPPERVRPLDLFPGLDDLRPVSFALALAAAAMDQQWRRSDPAVDLNRLLDRKNIAAVRRAMRKALKISNDESDQLTGILNSVGILLAESPPGVATCKRFIASPWSADARRLLDGLERRGLAVDRIQSLKRAFGDLDQVDCAPRPLITGDDLRAAGLTPGPQFKTILHAVYDAQLEARVRTPRQAMKFALALARPTRPPDKA